MKNEYLTKESALGKSYHPGYFLPGLLVVLIFIAALYINIRPAYANYYTTLGIDAAKLGENSHVQQNFERALSYSTYMDQEIRQRLVDNGLIAIASGKLAPEDQNKLYDYMVSELDKSLKEAPLDVKNYLYLMNILNRLSGTSGALDRVIDLGQKALSLSPTRPQIYFEIGQAYFSKKDFSGGLAQFRKAVELNPEPKESHLNYMVAAIIAHQYDLADQEREAILQRGYSFNVDDYQSLASAFYQAGDKTQVVETYKKALQLDQNNVKLHTKLAIIYGDLCDVENAKAEVSKIIELDDSFVLDGQAFLRQLEKKCQK